MKQLKNHGCLQNTRQFGKNSVRSSKISQNGAEKRYFSVTNRISIGRAGISITCYVDAANDGCRMLYSRKRDTVVRLNGMFGP